MGERDKKEIGEGAMGSSSKQSERTDEEDITLDSRDTGTVSFHFHSWRRRAKALFLTLRYSVPLSRRLLVKAEIVW
jgi:hypothetical protein